MGYKPGTSGNPNGRPKGSRNKTTIARDKAIADGGLTPLSFMLEVLRNPDSTQEDKRWAAVAAAPFMHPRLAHRQYSGPDGGNIVVQIVRFTDIEEQAADEAHHADGDDVKDTDVAAVVPFVPLASATEQE